MMKMKMTAFGVLSVLVLLSAPLSRAEEKILPRMRISVENTAAHVHTQAVQKFAEELAEKAKGRLRVEFFHSAELFRDRDVLYALNLGKVEMAVPGTWHIDRYEPSAGIFLLPVFYGREPEYNYRVLAGPAGDEINRRIEDRLGVKIPGRWIDLGHAHLFSIKKPILRHADIEGMPIRVAGGVANEMRIRALGGKPTTIAWPDLPGKLSLGVVDGVLTTHETIASARLWEYGIRYAFEDREYFPQYVPLIRGDFWNRLPDDLREIITEIWESHVAEARRAAAAAQAEAREMLLAEGVKIVTPDRETLRQVRQKLLADQDRIVEAVGIRPDVLALVRKAIRDMKAETP